jgi:hypothetical protein
MKNKNNRHVSFSEPHTNESGMSDSTSCIQKTKPEKVRSTRKQNSYFKKIQEYILEKLKKGNIEEAVQYMLDLDRDFVNKILSSNNYKIINWSIRNEVKVFNIMIDLLNKEKQKEYLNECIPCVAFIAFLSIYKSKSTYNSQTFIEGLNGFFKIDAEGCKKAFERYKVVLNEQIEKDFQAAVEEFESMKSN